MPKVSREDLGKIANLGDADKANLFSLFDEALGLETEIVKLRKEKGDADVIASKAETAEKLVKEKDAKIAELSGLIEKHTGKKSEGVTLAAFAPFFSILGD